MQEVHNDLLTALRAQDVNRARRVSVLYELYHPGYLAGTGANSSFDPLDALDRFAGIEYSVSWQSQTVSYRREVIGHVRLRKNIGKQLNSVSVTVSNVSRNMSQFVLDSQVQGMWMVVRWIDRSVSNPMADGRSGILFVGRCEKPDGFDRSKGTLSAKPHIGNINVQIPSRQLDPLCPLDFKGEECLGSETLAQKSTEYQQAFVCNKTEAQCNFYANERFRQGVKLVQIESSFVHKGHTSFLRRLIHNTIGLHHFFKGSRETVGNSVMSGAKRGDFIPVILGRVWKVLVPLQYQDQGEALWFKAAAGRGKISDFINTRGTSEAFTGPFGVIEHLGEYGGDGTQVEEGVLPGERWLSRIAYIMGYYLGTKIEVEDPIPETMSLVAGIVPDEIYFDVDKDGTGKLAAGTGGVSAAGSRPGAGSSSACGVHVKVTLQDIAIPAQINDVLLNGQAPAWDPAWTVNATVGPNNEVTKSSGTAFWNAGTLSLERVDPLDGDQSVTLTFKSAYGGNSGDEQGSGCGLSMGPVTPGHYNDIDWLIILFGDFAGESMFIQIYELGVGKFTSASGAVNPDNVYKIERDSAGVVRYYVDDVLLYTSDHVCVPGNGPDWTDNPVDHARYVFTDPALLANPTGYVDDFESAYAAAYNCGAIKDETNGERCLLPDDQAGFAGIQYKRYHSTGLLGPASFDLSRTQIPAGVPDREAAYEFFDPDNPPTEVPSPTTVYRKRFTSNTEVTSPEKLLDFMYDTINPTHRGFLRWNSRGQIVFDSLRPADHTTVRQASLPDDDRVAVLDASHWKTILGSPFLLQGKVLIGMHLATSEVRRVVTAEWSPDGDAITLVAVNAIASSATLLGGSSAVQSSATVTLSVISDGTVITVTVDGIDCSMECETGETLGTAGHRLACSVNADPVLREYVEAHSDEDGVMTVSSKYGVLVLERPLEQPHLVSLSNPTDPPVLAVNPAGSIGAGLYAVCYSYRNANGQTKVSPAAIIEVIAGETIDAELPGALPAGADNAEWFVSRSPNDTEVGWIASNDGTTFNIASLPEPDAARQPVLNTTGEEVLRVMASYAGQSLSYADTEHANILDGTFEWPEGGSRSEVNRLNGTVLESVQDFAEQPLVVDDRVHQRIVKKQVSEDVNLKAVDNSNTGARLLNGEINTLRGGDMFFSWGSAGEALLHDEGDVVCVSDRSGGHQGFRNVPVRLRDVSSDKLPEVRLSGRIYYHNHYGDLIAVLTEGDAGSAGGGTSPSSGGTSGSIAPVIIPSSVPGLGAPPPVITFDQAQFPPDGLTQSTDGLAGITSIRGGVVFGFSLYAQYALVRVIIRAGSSTNELIATVQPGPNRKAVFEFVASSEGLYRVQLEVCNQWGCNLSKPTADIVVGMGVDGALLTEASEFLLTEAGEYMVME